MRLNNVKEAALKKTSTTLSDILTGSATGLAMDSLNLVAPGLGTAPAIIGTTHGLLSDELTDEDIKALNENKWLSFVPGVSSSRLARRWKEQTKDKNGGHRKTWSQAVGPVTSLLASGLLGTAVGAGAGTVAGAAKGDAVGGATAGAAMGGLAGLGAGSAATILSMLAAAITRRRTAEEQEKYIESGNETAMDYLIPGHGVYNYFKTVGRMMQRDKDLAAANGVKTASLINRVRSLYC